MKIVIDNIRTHAELTIFTSLCCCGVRAKMMKVEVATTCSQVRGYARNWYEVPQLVGLNVMALRPYSLHENKIQ